MTLREELKQMKRWVAWREEYREGQNREGQDKPTKVPYCTLSRKGSSTNSDTWLTIKEALKLSKKLTVEDGLKKGVGIILGDLGNGKCLWGIDIDHAVEKKESTAFSNSVVQEVLYDRFVDTYIEWSPSKKGLHILCVTDETKEGPKEHRVTLENGIEFEIYNSGRYFTLTGNKFQDLDIIDKSDEIDWFLDTVMNHGQKEKKKEKNGWSNVKNIGGDISTSHLSNEKVLEKLFEEDNEWEIMYKDGYIPDQYSKGNGEADQSRADMALLYKLAFYCNKDYKQIEELFNKSAYGKRDKWISRADYRERSIQKAINNIEDGYGATEAEKHLGEDPIFQELKEKQDRLKARISKMEKNDQPESVIGPLRELKDQLNYEAILFTHKPFLAKDSKQCYCIIESKYEGEKITKTIELNSGLKNNNVNMSMMNYHRRYFNHVRLEAFNGKLWQKAAQNVIEYCGTREHKKLYTRIAHIDDNIIYDLARPDSKSVKMNKDGWDIIDTPQYMRWIASSIREQLMPKKPKNLEQAIEWYNRLGKLCNLSVEDKIIYMTQIPTIIMLYEKVKGISFDGPAGSGKTEMMQTLLNLVDPKGVGGRPSSEQDLAVILTNNYTSTFDNLSSINRNISDMFCRAITGAWNEERLFYTNSDLHGYDITSHLLWTSTRDVIFAGDLKQRMWRLDIPKIKRENSQFPTSTAWENYRDENMSYIFGGLLTIICEALKLKEEIEPTKNVGKVRFYTAYHLRYVVAKILGISDEDFYASFFRTEDLRNSSILYIRILVDYLLDKYNKGQEYTVIKTTDILMKVEQFVIKNPSLYGIEITAEEKDVRLAIRQDWVQNKFWPKDADWAQNIITKNLQLFEDNGFDVEEKITKTKYEDDGYDTRESIRGYKIIFDDEKLKNKKPATEQNNDVYNNNVYNNDIYDDDSEAWMEEI